jgi:DNA-binding GntR family transcriptional regulator
MFRIEGMRAHSIGFARVPIRLQEEPMTVPRVQRHEPLHMQISAWYREAITEGRIAPGEQLPPIREMASQWGAGQNTAARAVEHLRGAGLVVTSTEGTFAAPARAVPSPQQRMRLGDGSGEQVTVISAGLADTPGYVAGALGVPAGLAVRREQVYSRAGGEPVTVQVTWCPGWTAAAVPELAAAQPLPDPAGPAHLVSARFGRPATRGRVSYECRRASGRERDLLQLEKGSYVLAGTYWWADAAEVLEYGELVLPPGQVAGTDMEP